MSSPADDQAEDRQHEHRMVQLATFTIPAGSARIKPQTLKYCPTMDLIAAAHEDESWNVWRLGGSRVFGGNGFQQHSEVISRNASRVSISAIEWKSNGMLLAIACSDNAIRLISSYTGKQVHVLLTDTSPSNTRIGCLGWNVNVTDPMALPQRLKNADKQRSLDEILDSSISATSADSATLKADLPRDLALIDTEASFPKLSTLPATGAEDDVFSSRQSIDTMFHENSKSSDQVDVLTTGFENGYVHLKMFDSFEVGSVHVGSIFEDGKCKILRHSSQMLSPVHVMVVERTTAASESELFIITVSLRFITASPRYLSVIASKATQLQNLLRYIHQVQTQINFEWKSAQELPIKFLGSINEDLQECGSDFVTSAYHLVATGDCPQVLKEFLAQTLGDRGHKRWEKAVSNGYETMRRLVHECLLPAVERCQVIVSRLRGLSLVRKAGGVLGVDSEYLDFIDDALDMLNLLGHKLLLVIGKDLKEFRAFEKWLKLEIEFQGLDEQESEHAEGFAERMDAIEHRLVLDYISGPLTKSNVLNYIQATNNKSVEQSDWTPQIDGDSFYDTYKSLILRPEMVGEQSNMPHLHDLTSYLRRRCADLFSHIADTLRKSIMLSTPVPLPKTMSKEVFDIKMMPAPLSTIDDPSVSRILIVGQHGKDVAVFEVPIDGSGKAPATTPHLKQISLDDELEIKDIRFVDTESVMILRQGPGESRIESLGYQNLEEPKVDVKHVFDHTRDKSRALRLEVNGRKGRRVVCVLFDDRRHYAVYDIDNGIEPEAGEEDQGEREDEGGTDSSDGGQMQQD